MLIVPYDHNRHLSHMIKLLRSQGVKESVISDLPQYGLIAFEDGMPIAAGFIRCMEGSYALMDSYVASAKAPMRDKHRAIIGITNKIVSWAMMHNISKLLCFSEKPGIIKCAKRAGFKALPNHKSMVYLVNN